MRQPVAIIGMGEIGGVFARGLLRIGCPVYPVTRRTDLTQAAAAMPPPQQVLVTVGENDLHPLLQSLPAAWRDRLALVQNELLPRDWERYACQGVSVVCVWFEKKPGQDSKVLLPSPIHGPGGELLSAALSAINIPNRVLADARQLLFELVCKNVYILTTNIAGLEVGGTVQELWQRHRVLALAVAREVMQIQKYLTGAELPAQELIDGMVAGIDGDPQHKCMGRSAPQRLTRALAHADAAGMAVPTLRRLHAQYVAGGGNP